MTEQQLSLIGEEVIEDAKSVGWTEDMEEDALSFWTRFSYEAGYADGFDDCSNLHKGKVAE